MNDKAKEALIDIIHAYDKLSLLLTSDVAFRRTRHDESTNIVHGQEYVLDRKAVVPPLDGVRNKDGNIVITIKA